MHILSKYLRFISILVFILIIDTSCLNSKIITNYPLTFLNFRNSCISKNYKIERKVNQLMNDHKNFKLNSEASDHFYEDSFFYSDDDGKLILTGIEVHSQLASPYKAFCSCRSTASPVTNLNVSKHPDVYKTEPAKNRKKVYEGFKNVLENIVSNHQLNSNLSKTHTDSNKPMMLEDYIKLFYESEENKNYGDVDEKELNEMFLHENEYTCPGCKGEVGATPYISPMSLLYAIGVCKVFDCKISNKISFDRKCYEYFDLPKGYQITQTLNPLGRDGHIKLSTGKIIKISQVQFEEDTARRVHDENDPNRLDFNRSGIALAEIVTEPYEMTRSEILETCRKIYERLVLNGLSNGNRFRGNFRFDINLSRSDGSNRIEVKNLNSFLNINKSVKNYDPEKDYSYKQDNNTDITVLGQFVKEEVTKDGNYDNKGSMLEKIKNVFLSVLKDIPNKDKYTPLGTTVKWDKDMGLQPTREKMPSEIYGNYFETNIPVIYQSDEFIKKVTDCLPKEIKGLESLLENYPNVNKELLKEIYKHHSWTDYFEKLCQKVEPQVAASHFVNIMLPIVKTSEKKLMPVERFSELLKMVVNHRLNLVDLQNSLNELMEYNGSLEEYFNNKNMLLYDLNKTKDLVSNYLKNNPPDYSKSENPDYITKLTAAVVHSADSKISYQYVRDYVSKLLKK